MKQFIKKLSQSQKIPFDKIVLGLIYNRPIGFWIRHKEYLNLQFLKKLDKILIISDVNIGDSIMLQTAVESFRYYFPNVEIDYMYNAKVDKLIGHNPSITTAYPLFHSSTDQNQNQENLEKIHDVLQHNNYDLILNVCPLVTRKDLKRNNGLVITAVNLLLRILNSHKRGKMASLPFHVVDYINQIIDHLPARLRPTLKSFQYNGTFVYLDRDVVQQRSEFVGKHSLSPDSRFIFINPDTSNIYTFIQPEFYVKLIHSLLQSGQVDGILLGRSYKFKGTSTKIYNDISAHFKDRVTMLPRHASLAFYAAMVDWCDGYVTGDTGPLHIAAAQKVATQSDYSFSNNTVIVSLFKATEPTIYGYDSFSKSIIDSSQSAPARAYELDLSCKDITCSVQRIIKTCDATNCMSSFRADEISDFILQNINHKERPKNYELSPSVNWQ